ncbi:MULTISPECIES: multicopper oxidase domain-containing protein [unclassified Acinetobacter]|uniref:multicopper oxidase domain-containing protein n=1 Tax=unclassified Acinetobacter TaxID=196816 RepID=UPI002575CD3F|nr:MULTISPECIES: multicopper oxidase domain-containing protein [unclassified Acinetobacter]MDM1763356.1 multicopper oxidase domain-containing protein [Acinetobacter sp. 226-1]MDM1766835.1 multicopper oxidase domain-containing protein [Acinetobacter sp. 226-4]
MSIQFSKSVIVAVAVLSSTWSFAAVKEYHLNIDEGMVNVTGKAVKRITVNGKFPAPLLEFEEGDDAVIHVHNNLKNQDSSIHWHGLLLPGIMDGVPGFNGFNGIRPQGDFVYKFKVRQSGTYWYHAHSKGQEQDGLYGALVIYPKDKKPLAAHEQTERDYVVMLSDFHDKTSDQIQKDLKISAEYYQDRRETLGDVWKQVQRDGVKATWSDRKMWNQMRMLKTDLSDVTGYTFLINGKTPEQNWTGMFKPNEKVRLRFINASAMSFFDVRIPNLKMTVVGADGQPVQPVPVDEFRIGTAETYDVVVEPKTGHYQIEAESIDRSGFAIGTLHNELTENTHGIHLPQARPRAILNMADMGHGSADMQGMDHSKMDHSQHQPTATKKSDAVVEGWANASTPQGDKALQYSDLKSLTPQPDTREATSELVIRLGGTMERYIWTINGKKFSDAEPLKVKYGERIRIKFINDSMMAHPMHLHGMFMQLENGQPAVDMPNKHTIVVPPAKTVTALLTADELGEWAIHCHLLYHMSAGMMNKLIVANVSEGETTTTPIQKAMTNTSNQAEQQGDQHAHH